MRLNPTSHPPWQDRILRFSRAERAVHWALAVLMGVSLLTAAVLYNGSLAVPIGHRHLVELIHVYSGFGLPVPILVGMLSRAYRSDMHIMNRFTPADWQWLRSRTRRDGRIPVGKFNAGQKVNATLTTGAILVLLGTGVIMYFPDLTRLAWRTGATFVHDWFALGLGLLVLGHLTYAIKDPESRRGMTSGSVSTAWARNQHNAWAAKAQATAARDDDATPAP